MQRTPRSRRAVETRIAPRGQRNADIPEVPTFQPAPTDATAHRPPASAPENPDEEAVRRMVEAAYT